jgi:hypothetical protein
MLKTTITRTFLQAVQPYPSGQPLLALHEYCDTIIDTETQK